MTQDEIKTKLKEINQRVIDRLGAPVNEQEAYGTIKTVFKKAIELGDEMSDEMQTVLNSGILDRKEYQVDREKAELFDKELTKEINKAIRSGELPNPKTIRDPFVTKLRKLWRKSPKNK